MRKFSTIFYASLLVAVCKLGTCDAQTITGPTSVDAGTTAIFTLSDDVVFTRPNWSVDNGVLISQTHSGLNHSVRVRFDCPGVATIELLSGSTILYTLDPVTVTCQPIAVPVSTFTYTIGCGTGSITRNSAPSADVWYWQTDPNGTSTNLGSGATINLTSSGMYYLRAAKNTSVVCCWSPTSLATIYVDISPPSATASAQTICSGQTTSISITGSSGTTYSWTVTSTNVSGATGGSGATINQALTATSNTLGTVVYQITPAKGSCNGTPVNVTATVKPVPTSAVSPSNSSIFSGNTSSILISNPNNIGGTAFSWTATSSGVTGASNASGTSIAQALSGSGTVTYLVTPSANGCVGQTVAANVTVNALPTITASQTRIVMGPVTLTGSNGFTTYSWKDADNQEVSTTATYTTSAKGTYTLTVTKNGVTGTASATYSLLGQLDGINMNYIVSNTILTPVTSDTQIPNLPIEKINQSIQYFDELGRPIQTVITKGSPSQMDIVQPVVYDQYGRELRKYLPVTTGSDGVYKTNLLDGNGNFTTITYSSTSNKIAMDTKPYSETVLEPSPLNRVLKQGAPGAIWQPNTDPYSTADYTVKKRYDLNAVNEVLQLSYNSNSGVISGTNIYFAAGQLKANRTFDEHNNEVVEYVDKEGRVICKKVKVDATQYAKTYYIYDDLGNLIVVLPPEAVKALTN